MCVLVILLPFHNGCQAMVGVCGGYGSVLVCVPAVAYIDSMGAVVGAMYGTEWNDCS